MKKDSRTYFIKITEKGEEVVTHQTKSLRRFIHNVRLIQFTDSMKKNVLIRVSYGLKENNLGKREMFTNSGTYTNHKDLLFAALAFSTEK